MKINIVLKWVACAVTLVAALLTSFQIYPLNIYMLNAGSFLYMIWSIRVKELNLVLVNAGLLIIYFIGALKSFLTLSINAI